MKEYFINEIDIEKMYHLSNIKIKLNPMKRQHLLLTGKNGSGKTSLLLKIKEFLTIINDGMDCELMVEDSRNRNGVRVELNEYEDLGDMYREGEFITAYFPAERKAQFEMPLGVENVKLADAYRIDGDAGNILLKYMVHLKTQQAYARNEGAEETAQKIQEWFDRFESALRILLDEKSVHLEYDYKKYNFKIHQDGREAFNFHELSDGYSSVIYIVSDLILRMDKNWLLRDEISQYDCQGIVLIDELETHLHIELQKKILPFLTEFFPRLQFIITTHSPYILNSISNAKAYDLERHVELDNLSVFSSGDLAEGYFEAEEYSDELKGELEDYEKLCFKEQLTEDERADRAALRIKFKNLSADLSGDAKQKFEDIERRRQSK